MASSRFDGPVDETPISNSNWNSNSNSRPPRRIELQAPRAASTTLMLREESRAIDKRRKPVIIYMVSPTVIHAEASEFMSLVQRLTGPDSPPTRNNNNSSSSETPKSFTAHRHRRTQGHRQFPVRVKARTLNPSRSIEASADRDHHLLQSRAPVQPISPTLFLRDLCAPSIGGGSSLNWLLHGDDLSSTPPPSSLRGSQNYLDIFSQE